MSQTTTVLVSGMTCAHCVHAVTTEVSAVPGVTAVDITLVAGGDSPVNIVSDEPVDLAAVGAAVDEAGYSLRG